MILYHVCFGQTFDSLLCFGVWNLSSIVYNNQSSPDVTRSVKSEMQLKIRCTESEANTHTSIQKIVIEILNDQGKVVKHFNVILQGLITK